MEWVAVIGQILTLGVIILKWWMDKNAEEKKAKAQAERDAALARQIHAELRLLRKQATESENEMVQSGEDALDRLRNGQ